MNSFVDTNVSIAYIFSIDPLNNKSLAVFGKYKNIFWSKFVKSECKGVFKNKRRILIKFYKDLSNNIKAEDFHDFSFDDLKSYVMRNYPKGLRRKQILSSLERFWDTYVKESFPTYDSFAQAIENCLNDLKNLAYSRKEEWEANTLLTYDRVDEYLELKSKLNSLKVHPPDDEIVLDAYDFNFRTDFPLDFITFDDDCYEGASQIEEFHFNSVKGKYDFL